MLHTILFRIAATTAEDSDSTPMNIILSNLAGSASILCWFIVFTPQLWVNYKRKSGESLSLTFLYIWLAGDVLNVLGATMDNLLLTMRILAWYYTLADIGLIAQVHYYRRTSAKASFEAAIAAGAHHENGKSIDDIDTLPTEITSLIVHNKHAEDTHQKASKAANNAANSISIATLPTATRPDGYVSNSPSTGYGTTSTSTNGTFPHASEALSTMSQSSREQFKAALTHRRCLRSMLLLVLPILATGFFVWTYFDWLKCLGYGGEWEEDSDGSHGGAHCGRGHGRGRLPPLPGHEGHGPDEDFEGFFNIWSTEKPGTYDSIMPLVFGWGSAALYLGSRVPQIYKNWRLQSCEGLSMFMFLFSVMGNGLYVASIFLNSTERTYLIRNMPYWLGSTGTLIFDFTIFTQFYVYRHNQPLTDALKEAADSDLLSQDDDSLASERSRHHDIEQGR
ncbi:hypothetical protein BGZ74_003055 [Mortierella antarctica]|nr:hypothetical protein BGZ74_003055 [Mortierella antarctica]